MKPKRSDDKYWVGTRNFNNIQFEDDLESYIIDLEFQVDNLKLKISNLLMGLEVQKVEEFISKMNSDQYLEFGKAYSKSAKDLINKNK